MKNQLLTGVSILLSLTLLAACGTSPAPSVESSTTPAAVESSAPLETDSPADQSLKIGAIFAGAINDGNWNETQYNGLKRIEAMGNEINYMENISDADAAEAARTYGEEGFDLVYLSTNSYQDFCLPVSSNYPDTIFVQINGSKMGGNFISVRVADEEQGFMLGLIAALLSESGKVGLVGGMEINPIILGSSGFQQGVDYADATYGLSVEAVRINTGSFIDVNKAKETAISMIESGCDVIAPMVDDSSVGVMESAEEKGIMAIASGESLISSAPTATQVAVIKDISLVYDATYGAFVQGQLHATDIMTYGAKDGVVHLASWKDGSDPDLMAKAVESLEKVASGEVVISIE